MRPLSRREFAAGGLLLAVTSWALPGCSTAAIRAQTAEDKLKEETSSTKLVGDYAQPFGMNWVRVEQVGLVTGLSGTGSDPGPTAHRAMILDEMKKLGVPNPNKILADPNNSIVLLRAEIPPGVQKGDRLDVQVRLPSQSETLDLRNGRLLEARMKEVAVINEQLHEGHYWAEAKGPLMVDPFRVDLTHALILGGGIAVKERNVGLVLRGENKSIRVSSQIGAALNKRFHIFQHGEKRGVAVPKTDEYIELSVYPRYKHNLARYMKVVRCVALQETEQQRIGRMQQLETQLLNSVTASNAALKLEAVGNDGVKILKKGLESNDLEVRFYAAEALAYLNEPAAAKPLVDAARDDATLRPWAFTALSAMDDIAAYDALRELLSVASPETRYGAFRALFAINDHDPLVRGEKLGDQMSLHLVKTEGPALIHAARSQRAELVLFGPEQKFRTPVTVQGGSHIVVKSINDEQITVKKFDISGPDQCRTVSTKVEEVIRAIIELGGTYPDVVQALQEAKTQNALEGRFEIDAIADQKRLYEKLIEERASKSGEKRTIAPASPLGDLFGGKPQHSAEPVADEKAPEKESGKKG